MGERSAGRAFDRVLSGVRLMSRQSATRKSAHIGLQSHRARFSVAAAAPNRQAAKDIPEECGRFSEHNRIRRANVHASISRALGDQAHGRRKPRRDAPRNVAQTSRGARWDVSGCVTIRQGS